MTETAAAPSASAEDQLTELRQRAVRQQTAAREAIRAAQSKHRLPAAEVDRVLRRLDVPLDGDVTLDEEFDPALYSPLGMQRAAARLREEHRTFIQAVREEAAQAQRAGHISTETVEHIFGQIGVPATAPEMTIVITAVVRPTGRAIPPSQLGDGARQRLTDAGYTVSDVHVDSEQPIEDV